MSLFYLNTLTQFTGTERYYRIGPKHVLTDGTKHLADQVQCYWLMDAIASHVMEIPTLDWFILVKTYVKDSKALMLYEDGNGLEHARQEIQYTDFPLAEITLYACWDGDDWVIMLPNEY